MKSFLPEQTRLSQVHLRTANLKDAQAFYTDVLGLKVRHGLRSHLPVLLAQPLISGVMELIGWHDYSETARRRAVTHGLG